MRRHRESGQTLITGLVMMAVLVLVILYAFDVHNVIRAKLKVDVAQQAAAMTGAIWQKESLNLIGEINLLKASALLMEGSENWKDPLPDPRTHKEAWKREMQSRVDLLTEMQTRVSFVGPLVGFAAAQQSAKNNGLNRFNNALHEYLELLKFDKRYIAQFGGAPVLINNYDWREPYIDMVKRISENGIAVFPNARTAGMPQVRPPQLAKASFYSELHRCAQAIAAGDPPKKHYWNLSASILRSMDDIDFSGKWWDISYDNSRFPMESEIFTLGVEFDDAYTEKTVATLASVRSDLQHYSGESELPARMKWCNYDLWWFPKYYKDNYPEYEHEHYNYWFGGGALREKVKPQYIYEGPAAYTEGYADVTARVNVRPSVRPYGRSIRKRDARESLKSSNNSILLQKSRTTTRIGSRRGTPEDSVLSTDYRPGSIAKVLGALNEETPPIAVDMILPVFTKVSPMPTFMPIPYGFQVLVPHNSLLNTFLNWLAEQKDLNGVPPEGTEAYLQALRFLVYGIKERAAGKTGNVPVEEGSRISGRALRYYGYNHKFNRAAFENEFRDRLWEWNRVRKQRVFQQNVLDGPGYLQEPQLFSNSPKLRRVEVEEIRADGTKVKIKYYVVTRNDGSGTQHYKLDEETRKVPMPDAINGGTAHRVYLSVANNAAQYYVIDSRGRIVLNGSPDPTIMYNRHYGTGGTCQCEGECTCKSNWNPGRYDGDKGPIRL